MDPLEAHLSRQIERSRGFFWHRLRWKAVAEHLPTDRPFELLDIGAGAGVLAEFLARDFPQGTYRFVEPIPSLREHLASRYGADRDAATRDRYDGIDVITLLDVLEHQEDDRAFLADLVGRMSAGSTLVITVPAMRSLWSWWDVALGHHRRYDAAGLRRTWIGLPVVVEEVSYLFPELVPAGYVRAAWRRPAARVTEEAAFPDLPRVANEVLYLIGSATLRARRWWPLGTSLFAVVRRS